MSTSPTSPNLPPSLFYILSTDTETLKTYVAGFHGHKPKAAPWDIVETQLCGMEKKEEMEYSIVSEEWVNMNFKRS